MLWLYRFFNVLSIDVAVGAVVCAAFFVHIFQIQLSPYCLASLGVSVWIIYSTDHLMDVRKLNSIASTTRHQFHQRYFWMVGTSVVAAAAIDLMLILQMERPVLAWGAVLLFFVLLYLLLNRRLGPWKECFGAILYSLGILLPGLSLHTTPISVSLILLMGAFVLTALLNLILFSWFDYDLDVIDKSMSVVIFQGKQRSRILLGILFIFQGMLLTLILFGSQYQIEVLILMAMNIVLWMLFQFRNWFSKEEQYRLIGDMIFLFPFPYLIVNNLWTFYL